MSRLFSALAPLSVGAVGAVLPACSGNAPDPIQAAPTAPIATNYTVLDDQSTVAVSATQEGETFTGSFERFEAEIRFDRDDLPGSEVRVRLPLAGLDLGNADRNDAIPGRAWFDTRLHPVATFEARRIVANGDGGYVADGELTMKGFTAPVSLPFTLQDGADGTVVMRGETVLDRTRWALGEAPWDTQEWVGHDVTVSVELVATPN